MINLFSTPIYEAKLSLNLEELQSYCYSIQSKDTGRQVSNRNGWQSHFMNLSDETFLPLYTQLFSHMNIYKDSLGAIGNVELNSLWININPPGGSNVTHVHPGCFMSGVYYVQTPQNCGNLYFENMIPIIYNWHSKHFKDFTHNTFAGDCWEFVPQANNIYIFPSWARHGVFSNLSKEDRISISFNGLLS